MCALLRTDNGGGENAFAKPNSTNPMINTTSRRSPGSLRHSVSRRFFNVSPLVLLPLFLGFFIFLDLSLVAQRVESVKDKVIEMRGVEFKKDLGRSVDGNWVYQDTMENKTNEAMVV